MHLLSMRVAPFAFRYQWNGATPCEYIDITRKAIDCATTLPLTVFIMAAFEIGQAIIFLPCGLYLLSFFFA